MAATGINSSKFKIELISIHPELPPPLAEQQRIVAKLDAAFAEIDGAIQLANSRKFQSEQLLQKILAMESSKSLPQGKVLKFAKACTLQRGFDLPKSQRKEGGVANYSALTGLMTT